MDTKTKKYILVLFILACIVCQWDKHQDQVVDNTNSISEVIITSNELIDL